MGNFRTIQPYRTPFSQAFQWKRGERLAFERKPSEWEGWLWCTDSDGRQAWLPEPWVDVEGDACILKRDYSSQELDLELGEIVSGEVWVSGWVWAENKDGKRGWAPLDHLEAV